MENPNGTIIKVTTDGLLHVKINTKDGVYASHMPYIKGGGLFIATSRTYQLGEKLQIILELMDETEPLIVKGKVVWQTPAGAQGGLTAGIGVQFLGENAEQIKRKMDMCITGLISSERRTDTL